MYHLAGIISFNTTSDRRRFRRKVETWVADWNTSHLTEEDFTLVRLVDTTYEPLDDNDVPTGVVLPALDFEYTTPSEASVNVAHSALHSDVAANAYVDIVGLSVWLA